MQQPRDESSEVPDAGRWSQRVWSPSQKRLPAGRPADVGGVANGGGGIRTHGPFGRSISSRVHSTALPPLQSRPCATDCALLHHVKDSALSVKVVHAGVQLRPATKNSPKFKAVASE